MSLASAPGTRRVSVRPSTVWVAQGGMFFLALHPICTPGSLFFCQHFVQMWWFGRWFLEILFFLRAFEGTSGYGRFVCTLLNGVQHCWGTADSGEETFVNTLWTHVFVKVFQPTKLQHQHAPTIRNQFAKTQNHPRLLCDRLLRYSLGEPRWWGAILAERDLESCQITFFNETLWEVLWYQQHLARLIVQVYVEGCNLLEATAKPQSNLLSKLFFSFSTFQNFPIAQLSDHGLGCPAETAGTTFDRNGGKLKESFVVVA